MIEILKKLVLDWTEDKAMAFHNNASGIRSNAYIWETKPNGTFLSKENASMFFENTGKIYKLTSFYTNHDWDKHLELYNISTSTQQFRIDIPILHNYVEIKNNLYLYTEIQRPSNRFGITFFHHLLERKIDRDYFLNFIDKGCIVLPYLRDISEKGLPEISLCVHKLMYDQYGDYWCDFKHWCISWDAFLSTSISMARDFSKNTGKILNIDLDDIEHIAREKWMKI
jgi:hypothetical protein